MALKTDITTEKGAMVVLKNGKYGQYLESTDFKKDGYREAVPIFLKEKINQGSIVVEDNVLMIKKELFTYKKILEDKVENEHMLTVIEENIKKYKRQLDDLNEMKDSMPTHIPELQEKIDKKTQELASEESDYELFHNAIKEYLKTDIQIGKTDYISKDQECTLALNRSGYYLLDKDNEKIRIPQEIQEKLFKDLNSLKKDGVILLTNDLKKAKGISENVEVNLGATDIKSKDNEVYFLHKNNHGYFLVAKNNKNIGIPRTLQENLAKDLESLKKGDIIALDLDLKKAKGIKIWGKNEVER